MTLLSDEDPRAVEIYNPIEVCKATDAVPGLLLCEHAGQEIPLSLKSLGLSSDSLDTHIAYDIGAENTAKNIARALSVMLIIQRYSRLVIDCNRPPEAADSIPEISHGTSIPGNRQLSDIEKQQRVEEIFNPLDHTINEHFANNSVRWAFSIHSFTPELNGKQRPWDLGLLFRNDTSTAISMAEYASVNYPLINIGLNQPYEIEDQSDWFIPQHAEKHRIANCLIEIRNDHIRTVSGQQKWAAIVADLIRHSVGNASMPDI
ncbi:hypothetical protein AB833_24280 [Chromatiales bacterium (ex Bugula neritina AB1)]|nr:hypothetical protein AB833_24280 [Chromatiales bacterium (ex Bugula neritina AB1)]